MELQENLEMVEDKITNRRGCSNSKSKSDNYSRNRSKNRKGKIKILVIDFAWF